MSNCRPKAFPSNRLPLLKCAYSSRKLGDNSMPRSLGALGLVSLFCPLSVAFDVSHCLRTKYANASRSPVVALGTSIVPSNG